MSWQVRNSQSRNQSKEKNSRQLRLDMDADLINFIEEQKENGKSPTEVFREVGVFYLAYRKKGEE